MNTTVNSDSCYRSRPSFSLDQIRRNFYNQKVHRERSGKMKKIILGLFVAIALAGCGQVYDREPVGVGYDNNELKLSPCACIMVYQA